MKPYNTMLADFLDLDGPESAQDGLWCAGKPARLEASGDAVCIQIPFDAQMPGLEIVPDPGRPARLHTLWVRAYGDNLLRLTIDLQDGSLPEDGDNPMLEMDASLHPEKLEVVSTEAGWEILDESGRLCMRLPARSAPIRDWSSLIEAPAETLDGTLYPDGQVAVPIEAYDSFFPRQRESFPLAYVERQGRPDRVVFSLHAAPNEKFAGTGERFAPLNLSGRTLVLENTDALGVNNRRCYKNVPFYLSSRPYGLLILTPAHVRLSLADISTRAAQGLVEDGLLDLFLIGGGSPERILFNYRCLTGFPRDVPFWSYGIWMSRMTYFSADETRQVAGKLRAGQFPCDVLHVDTGWFDKDWACDWKFSPRTFPDPKGYLEEMRSKGFRISLWQLPSVSRETSLFLPALAEGYIAAHESTGDEGSNFGGLESAGTIDFTNPAATRWYQGLLASLLELGVAAIKTDFGEHIDMQAEYYGMPAKLLHNLYALLYQKAAFEITRQVKGEGLIWARSGWVGSQRYPVHWGGDSACSWDGLAGSLRGGLHLGLSGFAFWSHDVPGFHGLPNFMNSWPADELYVRWTQASVFLSHMRYHGAQPREPYEYPAIADLVRKWWRLRYALIPYLAEAGRQAVVSGFPILRALIFHHPDDPLCWEIDDQFYCGDHFLVAPVMNAQGERDVYLPGGAWRDFWTGATIQGPVWLKNILSPLERIPIYVANGASVPVYPEAVQCTDEMDRAKVVRLAFDESYSGFSESILGKVSGL